VAGSSDTPPKAVVSRLSLYLRELQRLEQSQQETISSTQLGKLLGLSDAQVRKDLAHFGQFGYPGIGYRCAELIPKIKEILGTNQSWPVAIVGIGNLGRALIGYRGFGQQGFRIVIGFDIDPSKAGASIEGIPIFHLEELQEQISRWKIRLAILAVPSLAAQRVAEDIVAAGIEGILNFAPVTLNMPPHVSCVGVDLAMELEQLTFSAVNRAARSRKSQETPTESPDVEEDSHEAPPLEE
jgi:redox-sensing transcriptional repressor